MLFPYKRVPHNIERIQEFIDFIFREVWCQAPFLEYGLELFEPHELLHQIMKELFQYDMADRLKGAREFFYVSVNEIFNEFKSLSGEEIDQYRSYYDSNNSFQALCSNEAGCTPTVYDSLNPEKIDLNTKLKHFFSNLYSSGFWDLVTVKKVVEADLTEYYTDFVDENDTGICPFCGLLPIDGKYDLTREAYDHYLPKSKYPFNSMNVGNLAPACNKCNSGNKRDKDPLCNSDGERRRAFYPFSDTIPKIQIEVSIDEKKWNELTPERLSVELECDEAQEEVETWDELYRIKQRYAAKCCARNGGQYWLERVVIKNKKYKLTIAEMLEAELDSAASSPWVEANFLKKAFLEGCEDAGFFSGL